LWSTSILELFTNREMSFVEHRVRYILAWLGVEKTTR